jgi:hypothetical protein
MSKPQFQFFIVSPTRVAAFALQKHTGQDVYPDWRRSWREAAIRSRLREA